jgi:restriction endonuclease Mrr
MTLPEYQSVTLPLLRLAAAVPEVKLSDALGALSDQFQLTAAEREEVTTSGRTKMNTSPANLPKKTGAGRSPRSLRCQT